jgi:DNA polymerase-3 subunit alpha
VEVIRYITKKYGRDFVAQIASFGTLKAKAVVREVGRSLGMSFDETDRIAKLITEEMKMTHDKTLEGELNLRTLAALDPKVAKLIDVSKRLEGLVYNTSSHASGMVISDKPMTEYVPLFKGTDNEIVTQWDIKSVENSGLLVFDLFGLKALTLIQDALDNIRGMGGTPPDLDTLPFTDQATFDLFRQGDTDGIFQMESQGMRNYLRRLKPNCFEDLIAILALNQSGPLGVGMVEQFIQRVHGEFPVEYPHPSLEEPLKSTYGIIVYQEQIMTIAQMLGNFSPVESDRLCLAMGKNNPWELAELRTLFLSGARANDVREKKAIEIFDLMKKFSEYACNKSHFAAYVQISYYTAYLKAHYPMAFMAARIPPT